MVCHFYTTLTRNRLALSLQITDMASAQNETFETMNWRAPHLELRLVLSNLRACAPSPGAARRPFRILYTLLSLLFATRGKVPRGRRFVKGNDNHSPVYL